MASSKYLVISAGADGHIPFVEKFLDEPFLVVDPGKILRGTPLSHHFTGAAFEPFYDGVPLQGATAVWYRKPELALPMLTPRTEQEEFTWHAMSLFLRQLYGLLPDAFWVSPYYAMLRASDKLRQLTVAHRLGFNIPDTLVTSSEPEAQAFARQHHAAIVKPIETKFFILQGKRRLMLTQKVDPKAPAFPGLHLAPAIIQEAIDVAMDIRVTVVGAQTFAAAVAPAALGDIPAALRDWRAGDHYGGTTVEAFALPRTIAQRCVQHAREMGLEYCAIDLLLDKKGKFWFLENNPNGQWAFVEQATGQPIGKALARLLMRAKPSTRRSGRENG